MDEIGTYEERRFPRFRIPTLDTLDLGQTKHHIPLLLEVDITQPREVILELKAKTGERLSFTAFVIKCIGQAVSEHKHVHALRKGRKTLILFDDVDVSVIVERAVQPLDHPSETLPMPYIVRQANQKTIAEITHEIRSAQAASVEHGEVQLNAPRPAPLTQLFTRLPRFLRHFLVWRRLAQDPFFAKKAMGTVSISSIGSGAKYSGYGWAIPIGIHPLIVALGSMAQKPGVVGTQIQIREYLSMTVLFDHDVTDGAPVLRFVQRLRELLEDGYGLPSA